MRTMPNPQLPTSNDIIILQVTTFAGALVTAIQPIVSLAFMLVSIVSGCILIYKFFTNKK